MPQWTAISNLSLPLVSLTTAILFLTEGCSTLWDRANPEEKKVSVKAATLLYMADLHGQLEEHPEMFWRVNEEDKPTITRAGGLARISKVVNDIKAENPGGVIFMDAGDTLQGSGIVGWTKGEVLVPILNEMNLDLAVPGNWEVVYGSKTLKERATALRYPMIASNITDANTGDRVFKDYEIRNVGGIRIAIVGFTDPDVPTRQPPSYSDGFRYLETNILQPIVDKIRSEKSADAIVLLTHIGLPKAVELAGELKGVDVILSADTHERTYDPVVRGSTWVVEPGAFGSFLGRLDLKLENDGTLEKSWDLIELRASRYPVDPKILKMTNTAVEPYKERLLKPIGETKSTLYRYAVNETSLDAVLADALRESTGTQIALSNGFRFAYPILKGTVREQDLWNAYPISNNLRTGKVTGKQLREFWEREIENVYSKDATKLFGGWLPRPSGMHVRFDSGAGKGKRVKSIKIEDKEVIDQEVYTITTCAREGDPATTLCRIPDGAEVKDLDFDAHEAVRRYFRKNSPVKTPLLKRVQAVDKPEHMRSQFYGR
jgi:S-sulfosulfanyl-L-cysteine sulfohydrolase